MQNATWQILRIQNSCEDGCSRDSWCLFGSPMKMEQFLDKTGEMETELELIFIPTNFRYFNYLPWSVSPEDPSASYEFCAKLYTGNHGSEREGISEAGATCATRVLPHKKGALSQFKTHQSWNLHGWVCFRFLTWNLWNRVSGNPSNDSNTWNENLLKSGVNSFLLGLVSGSRESREKGRVVTQRVPVHSLFLPLEKSEGKVREAAMNYVNWWRKLAVAPLDMETIPVLTEFYVS